MGVRAAAVMRLWPFRLKSQHIANKLILHYGLSASFHQNSLFSKQL